MNTQTGKNATNVAPVPQMDYRTIVLFIGVIGTWGMLWQVRQDNAMMIHLVAQQVQMDKDVHTRGLIAAANASQEGRVYLLDELGFAKDPDKKTLRSREADDLLANNSLWALSVAQMNYFEDVAIGVERGYLDNDAIRESLGHLVVVWYDRLLPAIELYRVRHDRPDAWEIVTALVDQWRGELSS